MRVYRIEHDSSGLGPYALLSSRLRPASWFENLVEHSSSNDDRPTPWLDPLIGRRPAGEEYHGFDSIESLLNWFGPWMRDLEESGFNVVVYDCDEVLVGATQVLFIKHRAKKLGTLTPR